MCGIAGILSKNLTETLITNYSKSFSAELHHRGPDSHGNWSDLANGVLLSHNRLAINDLSSLGAQPMRSMSERYVIAFNGEVYNHKELRGSLEAEGCVFRGTSDTETMLAAIEKWGLEKAIKSLSGMFAFALWDCKDKSLVLCRDRIGEKPLYYGWIGETIYFSSELSAIEAVSPTNSLTLNYDAMHYLFKFGYIPSPHSIYNEISKLLPAHYIKLKLGDTSHSKDNSLVQYWSIKDIATEGLNNPIQSVSEAKSQLDMTLKKTISQQLSADVGVGLFLSGGIDSTTVTAIAQDLSESNVKTFTIGFPDKNYDESIYAENIAKHLGTDHLTLRINGDDAQNTIPDLSDIYAEPFADSSQIPAFLVSKLAREHVTVCLSGDGGDEIFAGYNRYLLTDKLWNKLQYIPKFGRQFIGHALETLPTGIRNGMISPFYKNSQGLLDSKLQKLIGLLKSNDIMHAYDFLSSYWQKPENIIQTDSIYNNYEVDIPTGMEFMNKAMFVDLVRYLEGDNLAKTDRASMAVSLETRLPLLNHELIELAWKIPVSMKVRDNKSKWILRQVLAQYVPDNLIDRPKMGFSVPIASWLRNELKEWAGDLIHSLKTNEHLNYKPIIKVWDEHQKEIKDHSHQLWTVLMFLSWQQNKNRERRLAA